MMRDAHEMPDEPWPPCRAFSRARALPGRAGCAADNAEATGRGRKKRKTASDLEAKALACSAMDTQGKSPCLPRPQWSPLKEGLMVLTAQGNGDIKTPSLYGDTYPHF